MGLWFDLSLSRRQCPDQSKSMGRQLSTFLGIQFAPLNVPLDRRLQTFGAIQWIASFLMLGFGSIFLCIYLALFTQYWWIVALYVPWYMYDWSTPERGGRRVSWFREMSVWYWLKDYFPIKLVKTAPMDPNKNYILGYHPHGIFSTGAFLNFATDATGFETMFPRIRPILLALAGQFMFPFFREYFMTTGACSCSRASIEWLLTREGRGNAVVLVVGGAGEVLEARPGSFTLIASSRKGFIRLAIQYGASLVPMFSFGENELYDQVPNPRGSFVRNMQEQMRKVFGFASPFFQGRGIFNYSFGLLPHRRPIATIVGAPIDVVRESNPSQERVEELRKQYFQALSDLFEEHKENYGVKPEQHLELI